MPDWEVRASTELPIVQRDEWDGDAATENVLSFFRDEDGDVDLNFAPLGFLLFDADSDGNDQENYKYPFADIVNGELVAITRGIEVADSFLQRSDGVGGRIQEQMAEVLNEYRSRSEDLNDPDEASSNLYVIPKDLSGDGMKTEDVPTPEFKREGGGDTTSFMNNDLGKSEKQLPYETFNAPGGVTKDVDTESRVVSGYYASWDTVDADNERFVRGAFKDSIEKDGPGSERQRIKHLYQHDIRGPVGKPRVLREDEFGLYFETEIVKTALGDDVLRMYEADLFEHSVGFMREEQEANDDGVTEIQKVQLMEGSSVTWGANPDTPFTGFKSVTDFADHLSRKAKALRELLEGDLETLDPDSIALGLRQIEASLAMLEDEKRAATEREKEGIEFPFSLFDEDDEERIDFSDTGSFF